jgi:Trk K+ transport system NAD-binding subunit
MQAEELYERWRNFLNRFDTETSHPDEEIISSTANWQIVIVGMGRVGTQTYDFLRERFGNVILGVDADQEKVEQHKVAGREVMYADISDGDFWRRLVPLNSVKLGVLTIPSLDAKLYAMSMAKHVGSKSKLVSITEYDDEIEVLLAGGADFAFNIYDEVGIGLASEICNCLDTSNIMIEEQEPQIDS